MRRWKLVTVLCLGVLYLLGCDREGELEPIVLVDDSPLSGDWYLQSVGVDRPIASDLTVRFSFGEGGLALYERTSPESAEPERHELIYQLSGDILSIDSDSEDPGVPRITGRVVFEDDGGVLRVSTHTDEQWLLTREALPGGAIESARALEPASARVDPMFARVQALAYACDRYVVQEGVQPGGWMDLVSAGLVEPASLTVSGLASDLPARFERMTDAERSGWLSGNSGFLLFGRHAGTDHASSVVVSTLPLDRGSKVVVGMANGAVHKKRAKDVAELLLFQEGDLPERWPASARPRESTAGLEPLSD